MSRIAAHRKSNEAITAVWFHDLHQNEGEEIVIDRFFETQEQALAWARAHPHFMTVRILTPQCQAGYSISRSHDAVIHVYDESGNVIETHEHKGDSKEP